MTLAMIGVGTPPRTAQGDWLPASIVGVNPTLAIVDGSATAFNVYTGHPYYPQIGDRVALTQFGSNYLALPVDHQAAFNTPDDLWHAVGDPGEPAMLNGFFVRLQGDAGATYGDALRFLKDRAGVVWIEGLLSTPAANMQGKAIFILPAGYRPAYQMCFVALSGGTTFQIGVDPSGAVYVQASGGTSSSVYLSLDTVTFLAEDGPTPPQWVDLGPQINTAAGWQATSGTWASTYTAATGAPYQGARYCIDAAGDVHFSGMVSNVVPGNTGNSLVAYLANLNLTGLNGNIDTDFSEALFTAACAGTPGFCRQDLFSTSIGTASFGNSTATSGWISLDGLAAPGGNNPSRYLTATLINSWAVFSGALPTLSMRINKFGTVYLRGLIKGTPSTIASANPSYGTERPGTPNVSKLFPAICGATAGVGINRTDIVASGVMPGTTLYAAQAAGTTTTGLTSLSGMRWTIKPYHS